jgi:phosphoribosylformimino-5-aminoimidazole carboxamide ribotide isomerase
MEAVILFPAIDLKDGLCVRLEQGDMARATVFNRDPAEQAYAFELAGFEYLHIVDLDGAFAGKPVNAKAVERILEATNIPLQLGGGIRDMAVREAAAQFPGKVAVGLDARDGHVAVQGWAEKSELSALDIARRFEDAGVTAIIYTDISRDGMLKGLNLEATIALADAVSIPVIASGGLASIEDIHAMLEPRARKLEGAIAGRALYDGRLNAAEALGLIRSARGGA